MGTSLVPYLEWKKINVLRKLEQTFRYFKVKENVEAQADGILSPYGLKSRLLPVLTTGVQGDYRTYTFALMVETPDTKIDNETLARLSTRLTNEISEINRVVFSITDKYGADDENFVDDYFLGDNHG